MHYLAEFETKSDDLCQGLVHFPDGPRLRNFYPDRWFHTVARLGAAHTGVPDVAVSLRTSLRAGRLAQLAFFTAPASAQAELRHYLARYVELLALVEDSVALSLDRNTHDDLAGAWASHICRLEPMPFSVGDAWLACDFRVLDFLPSLLEEAAAAGHDLLHQVHVHPWELTPDQERRARRNLVALERIRGVPQALLQLEGRLLSRRASRVLLVEEYVAGDTPAGASWLQRALQYRFEERFTWAKFDSPAFTFTQTQSEAISLGIHSAVFKPPGDEELFSSAVDLERRSVLFDWSGPLRRWFEPPLLADQVALRNAYQRRELAEQEEAKAFSGQVAGQWPQIAVSSAGSGYAFISYSHKDFPRIAPLLSGLNDAGFPYWFDVGIPGGSQWMSILQERLDNARALILFVSHDAVQSRFVQSEVIYANSKAKPILPVRLDRCEPNKLPGGLGLLLSSLQNVDAQLEHILHFLRDYPGPV
jgi:hypothetical protein